MRFLKYLSPVYWFNEFLIVLVAGRMSDAMSKPRSWLGKYFSRWRWVRRFEGNHWEKWLLIGTVTQYVWVRTSGCYHVTGIKPYEFAHLTVACEDYPSNTNQAQIHLKKA